MSNPSVDRRYSGLRKIYKQLIEAGYYEHGHIINYDDISNDLNALNLLVHKTYLKFNLTSTVIRCFSCYCNVMRMTFKHSRGCDFYKFRG